MAGLEVSRQGLEVLASNPKLGLSAMFLEVVVSVESFTNLRANTVFYDPLGNSTSLT